MSIYEGALGVQLTYVVKDENDVALDISEATELKFSIRKPDGTLLEVVPEFETDGTNGVLIYITTLATEMTPAGVYKVQPSFKLGLFDGSAEPGYFTVGRNV